MEFPSSKATMQRLTENERRRATGMLRNGSIQLNVARYSLSSADYGTAISRLEMGPICLVVSVHVSLHAQSNAKIKSGKTSHHTKSKSLI